MALLAAAAGLAVALILAGGKGPGAERSYLVLTEDRSPRYRRSDLDLGYAPAPGIRVHSTNRVDGEMAYEVDYDIDESGLRWTPGGEGEGPAVIFFGGSFAFGEGVENHETLPAVFASLRGGRVINAGFHGYGPHQMLRSLETGRLESELPDGAEHVVYLGHPGHIRRSAGRAVWDQGGPAYALREGGVSYLGPFRSPRSQDLVMLLRQTGPTQRLLEALLRLSSAGEEAERELYVQIVARSAELARERLGAQFTVLLWDFADPHLADQLRSLGLRVISVRGILGDDERDFVIEGDGHPAPEAFRRLGEALHRRLSVIEPPGLPAPQNQGSCAMCSAGGGFVGSRRAKREVRSPAGNRGASRLFDG
jgi:hypothetical protein